MTTRLPLSRSVPSLARQDAAAPGSPSPAPREPEVTPPPESETVDYAARVSPSNDNVLFLALNPSGIFEARHLRRLGHRVRMIADARTPGRVRVDGRVHRLERPDGQADPAAVRAFVDTLGLSPRAAAAVRAVLEDALPDARDELAQLAAVLARGEAGGPMPARIVVSGHHVPGDFFGEGNGALRTEDIVALAHAMPEAAARVEDLCLSACYSGSHEEMARFRAAFPGLKTIFAYDDSAPGTWTGAQGHLGAWARATRGSVDRLSPEVARGRKSENVVTWSHVEGRRGGTPVTLSELRAALAETEAEVAAYASGAAARPSTSTLRARYAAALRLADHAGAMPEERARGGAIRDLAVRLMAYDRHVRGRFAEAHGELVQRGYRAIGQPAPSFAALSRPEALAEIRALRRAVEGARPPPAVAVELLETLEAGLRDLDPRAVPSYWL